MKNNRLPNYLVSSSLFSNHWELPLSQFAQFLAVYYSCVCIPLETPGHKAFEVMWNTPIPNVNMSIHIFVDPVLMFGIIRWTLWEAILLLNNLEIHPHSSSRHLIFCWLKPRNLLGGSCHSPATIFVLNEMESLPLLCSIRCVVIFLVHTYSAHRFTVGKPRSVIWD